MPPHSQLDIPSLLHRIPLFSELSEADIQLVARYTRDRHIARGEMLFQRGDQPHGFCFVVWVRSSSRSHRRRARKRWSRSLARCRASAKP